MYVYTSFVGPFQLEPEQSLPVCSWSEVPQIHFQELEVVSVTNLNRPCMLLCAAIPSDWKRWKPFTLRHIQNLVPRRNRSELQHSSCPCPAKSFLWCGLNAPELTPQSFVFAAMMSHSTWGSQLWFNMSAKGSMARRQRLPVSKTTRRGKKPHQRSNAAENNYSISICSTDFGNRQFEGILVYYPCLETHNGSGHLHRQKEFP